MVENFLRAIFKHDHTYCRQIITNVDDLMDLLALVKNTESRASRQATYKHFPKTYIRQLILKKYDEAKITEVEMFATKIDQTAPVNTSDTIQSFSAPELEVARFLAQIAPPLQQENSNYQLHFFRQPTFSSDEEPVLATVVDKTWAL